MDDLEQVAKRYKRLIFVDPDGAAQSPDFVIELGPSLRDQFAIHAPPCPVWHQPEPASVLGPRPNEKYPEGYETYELRKESGVPDMQPENLEQLLEWDRQARHLDELTWPYWWAEQQIKMRGKTDV